MAKHQETKFSVPPAAAVAVLLRYGGPLCIVIGGLTMLRWSWLTWPDVLVDYGRELYMAWQLAEGQVAYSDLTQLQGPLSPFVNALFFHLFGVGLRTLVVCNLVILVVFVWLLYRLLLAISDRLAATVACLVFIALFAFGQLVPCGNYNFVCPYRHEMIHTLLLAVLALWLLRMYLERRSLLCVAGIGLCLGAAFLAKEEVFVAATAGVVAGLALALWAERLSGMRLASLASILVGSALVPPLAAFVALTVGHRLSPEQSLHAVLGYWPALTTGTLTSSKFVHDAMGTSNVPDNVALMLLWAGWCAFLFVPAAIVDWVLRKAGPHRLYVAAGAFTVLCIFLLLRPIDWQDAARPLPLVIAVLAVGHFRMFLRARGDQPVAARLALTLAVILFAFVMLLKMILNVHVGHYGFALAMPATLVFVVAVTDWLPAALVKLGGYGVMFRAVGLAVLVAAVVKHLEVFNYWFNHKQVVVASGTDAFRADLRGVCVNQILAYLAQHSKPGDTLAALPEGLMLNYLSRRVNPSPSDTELMPSTVAYLGEGNVLASMQAKPPDYIALVDRDTSEYGYRYFGKDYGQRLFAWIQKNYRGVALSGGVPMQGRGFGILLLERLDRATKSSEPTSNSGRGQVSPRRP